ncbi:MAG: 2-C-methyl-D-erythritol 4-phosphate cytidylyltransferase [Ruminiclostridium sp.]|nr:2-C-methyl-D-erythritol 4-phosphate cytidylyltransferase [Ruminiclostridium sp.]
MKKTGDKRICALIAAAGKGSRMNMDINKQYIEVGGKPILARTIEIFEDCGQVGEIILVVNSNDIVYCKQNIVDVFGFRKVTAIVAGGDTRQASVYNGLLQLDGNCGIVLIHDGARPFVSEESVAESIAIAREFGAACVAVPVKDTIKSADDNDIVQETLERSRLWSIQTPQTFRYGLILDAHKKALEAGFSGTDDAVLVERLGHPLRLVYGSYYNIKITTEEDLILAEAIAEKEM